MPTHPLSARLEQLEDQARQNAVQTVNRMRVRMDRLYGADVRPCLYGDRVATVRVAAAMLGTRIPVAVASESGCVEVPQLQVIADGKKAPNLPE